MKPFKKAIKNVSAFILLLSLIGVTACGGGGGGGGDSANNGSFTPTPPHDDDNNTNPPADDEGDSDPNSAHDNEDNSGPPQPEPENEPDQVLTHEEIALSIYHLDIAGARGFVITGADSHQSSGSQKASLVHSPTESADAHTENQLDSNTLYKIVQNGQLERVTFTDAEGEALAQGTIKSLAVHDLGPDFVYITANIANKPASGDPWYVTSGFLVNKDTGLPVAASNVLGDAHLLNAEDPRALSASLRFDAQGNIYLNIRDGAGRPLPTKIDISNLGSDDWTPTPLQTDYDTRSFELSADGTLLVYFGQGSSGTVHGAANTRNADVVSLLSTVEGLPPRKDPISVILGLDGDLYLVYPPTPGDELDQDYALYRLIDQYDSISGVKAGTLSSAFSSGEDPVKHGTHDQVLANFLFIGFEAPNTHRSGRMVVHGRLMYRDSHDLFDIDIPHQRLTAHDEVMGKFKSGASIKTYPTERHLWISGISTETEAALIVRYNPATYEITTLPVDTNIELDKFEPLDAQTIIFEGLRLSDESRIIGQMNIAGEIVEQTVYNAEQVSAIVIRTIVPTDVIRIDGSTSDWEPGFRVLNGAADGPVGHDLVHYSERCEGGEYFGLVEFEGRIDNEDEAYTRIDFDTHSIDIGSSTIAVREGSEQGIDAFDTGASLAIGSAIEFAIDNSLLGPDCPPHLNSVERYVIENSAELRQDILSR